MYAIEGELTETRDDFVGVLKGEIAHALLVRLSGGHGTERYAETLHGFMRYLVRIRWMTVHVDDMAQHQLVGQCGQCHMSGKVTVVLRSLVCFSARSLQDGLASCRDLSISMPRRQSTEK